MKTSGMFTTHVFEIPFKNYGDPIRIIPLGDVHRSSPLCHANKWQQDLEKEKKLIDNTWYLGMGDYDDLASTSERNTIRCGGLHDSTLMTFENLAREHTNRLSNELSFAKGKFIGLLGGNHKYDFSCGYDTDQLLAEKLDTTYLGCSSFITLILRKDKHHCSRLDMWVHHGRSGGRTLGTSINNVAQMADIAEADIYLQGHDHKKHIAMKSRLKLSDCRKGKPKLLNRKILIARTGSYLKGYEENRSSYITDACMSPTDLGHITITLTPYRKKVNGKEENFVEINGTL